MMIAERKMREGKQNVKKKKKIPNPFWLALRIFSLSWEDAPTNYSFNSFLYFILCTQGTGGRAI